MRSVEASVASPLLPPVSPIPNQLNGLAFSPSDLDRHLDSTMFPVETILPARLADLLNRHEEEESEVAFLLRAGNIAISSIVEKKPGNLREAKDIVVKAWIEKGLLPTYDRLGDERLLPGTGFDVPRQVGSFLWNRLLFPAEMANRLSVSQTILDMKSYNIEYLYRHSLIFPIDVDIRKVNGEDRVWCSRYGKLWVDITNAGERDGVVKQSVKEMEKLLLSAQPGSLVLLASPPGWSGFTNSEGRLIVYPESQLHAISIGENPITGKRELHGLTFRTDMNLWQNRQLLAAFGQPINTDGMLEKDMIKAIVSNWVKLEARDRAWTFADVVETIYKVKGPFIYENQDINKLKRDLANARNLWQLNTIEKINLGQFKRKVKDILTQSGGVTQSSLGRIALTIGETIMQMAAGLRGHADKLSGQTTMYPGILPGFGLREFEHHRLPMVYRIVLQDLQELPGCGGGGTVKSRYKFGPQMEVVLSAGVPRLGVVMEETEKWDDGTCAVCGKHTLVGGCNICYECETSGRYKHSASSKASKKAEEKKDSQDGEAFTRLFIQLLLRQLEKSEVEVVGKKSQLPRELPTEEEFYAEAA